MMHILLVFANLAIASLLRQRERAEYLKYLLLSPK
jgi:hypothetical protein